MTELLAVERADAVATITLNRPESLNALNVALRHSLLSAIADVSADSTVRAVVVTGAGRAFCAGQDLGEHLAELRAEHALAAKITDEYNPITVGLATMGKPVIAAVNGSAAGAGAGLAFACDLRLASTSASFLIAFARVGLGLDTGVSWTLPRLIGTARATALALLAEPIGAEAALDMGMVNAVVEPDQLLPVAHELAERLAAGPTAAYAAIKDSIAYAATATLAESLAYEATRQDALGRTLDHRAATEAFIAKQPASFTGG